MRSANKSSIAEKKTIIAEHKTDIKFSLELYKILVGRLNHEVNNFLQQILWSVEEIATANENENYSKETLNSVVVMISNLLFGIMELNSGYLNLFDYTLEKHLQIIQMAYGNANLNRVDITGEIEQIKENIKHIVVVYMYILTKSSNINIKIDHSGILIGPVKNGASLLPGSQTSAGKMIRFLAGEVKIDLRENYIFIENEEVKNDEILSK